MSTIRAVLFDLHGTVAYRPPENQISETEISDYLFKRGYEVSPQQLKASWTFVALVDYPKYGYMNWRSFFRRIFLRLKVKVDTQTLCAITNMLASNPYRLYPDAAEAIVTAKENGFKTAIVTTIACFQFSEAIKPVKKYLDFVMTGYEAQCDKSNPKMYLKVLDILKVKPSEAVMIGDEIPLDIILPKRLGINAILLDRERKNKGQSVDASVYNLSQAMEIIIKQYAKQ